MAKKFREDISIKSSLANRSGLVIENMTSATPDNAVGTTFKNVAVNENGEFVVRASSDKSEGMIQFEKGTMQENQVYPIRSDIFMPYKDIFHYISIPSGYTSISFLNYQITVHDDTRIITDTNIIFEFGILVGTVFTPIIGSQAIITFADIISSTTVSQKDVILPLTLLTDGTKFCYRFTQLTGDINKNKLLSAEIKMFGIYK